MLSGISSPSSSHNSESLSVAATSTLSDEERQLIQEQIILQRREPGHVYTIEIESPLTQVPQAYNIIYTYNFQTGKRCFFLLSQSIGKGGQGEVLLAENLETRKCIAVKIHPESISADEDREQERKMLREFNRFVGVAQNQEGLHCTLMEYVPSIKLFDLLYERDSSYPEHSVYHFSKKEKLPLLKRAELILHALSRVVEFHVRGIAHRDVKTDNYVAELPLNTDLNPLSLIDVGSAYRFLQVNETDVVKLDKTNRATKGYSAPEMDLPPAERPFVTGATDLFSLGIVIAEILTQVNFQKVLRAKLLLIQEIERFDRNLTVDELRYLLSDVFRDDFVQPTMYEQALNADGIAVATFLHVLLMRCTRINPEERPDLNELIMMQSELKKLYGKYEISAKYSNPHYMQNILAARRSRAKRAEGLPSAEVSASSSVRRYIPESPKLSSHSQVVKILRETSSLTLREFPLSAPTISSLASSEEDGGSSSSPLLFSTQARRRAQTDESHPRQSRRITIQKSSPLPTLTPSASMSASIRIELAESESDTSASELKRSPKDKKKSSKSPALTKRSTMSELTKKFRGFGLSSSSHHHGVEATEEEIETTVRLPSLSRSRSRSTLTPSTVSKPSVPPLALTDLIAQPVVFGGSSTSAQQTMQSSSSSAVDSAAEDATENKDKKSTRKKK